MIPLLPTLGAAALGGLLGWEAYRFHSREYAPTAGALVQGRAYTFVFELRGNRPATKEDAYVVLKQAGFHPFALVQEPDNPNKFSTLASFQGHGAPLLKAVLPPELFVVSQGTRFEVGVVEKPVLYKEAEKTRLGRAATRRAPHVGLHASAGFWRSPVFRYNKLGYGPHAWRAEGWMDDWRGGSPPNAWAGGCVR
jgi:hypothetical protein